MDCRLSEQKRILAGGETVNVWQEVWQEGGGALLVWLLIFLGGVPRAIVLTLRERREEKEREYRSLHARLERARNSKRRHR